MRRNLKRFIAFRLLFNVRHYYPVFAVIQLDYGLTTAQFAVLNAGWAALIVLLGSLGVAQAWPIYGASSSASAPASTCSTVFTSHDLNATVESARRATVLRFKGLALNVGFGDVGFGKGALLTLLRAGNDPPAVEAAGRLSLQWLPWVFLASLLPLAAYWRARINRPTAGPGPGR